MPQVKLYVATSLDGFVARSDGGVDWLAPAEKDEDYGYGDFYESVDVLLMGRRSYEQVLRLGPWPYEGKICYVFARQAPDDAPEGVRMVSGDVETVLREARALARRDLWLVGGGELVTEFCRRDLVDQYILTLHPVLLGEGVPLFGEALPETRLHLEEMRSLPHGLVQVRYGRRRKN